MKTCTQFHIENVEPGDRLEFILDRDADDLDISGVRLPYGEVTARRVFRTSHFGWIVTADTGTDYYLNDYDDVRYVEKKG